MKSDKKANLIVACGENNADMLYAARLETADAFIYFETSSRRGVVVSSLEYSRAVKCCPADAEIILSSELGGGTLGKQAAALAAKLDISCFCVSGDFPFGIAEFLRKSGIAVECLNSPMFPQREFKQPHEVGLIRKSLRAAEAAMLHACDIIASSRIESDRRLRLPSGKVLTSEILRYEINAELLKHNCSGAGTIASSGVHSSMPHHAGEGAILAGTPVVMDIFPRSLDSGYWGDLTRTVVRGEAPEIVRRAHEAVRQAKNLAEKIISAGAIPCRVHEEAAAVLEQHNFHTGKDDLGPHGFFHSLGHGVGLEIHESPRLGPKSQTPLRGGEVVTVEPGLYYPEWGGIRIEDMVLVTSGGCEVLTSIGDELEL